MNKDNIMEVKGLHKRFTSKGVTVKAVTDVSFNVKPGETIGIVGESGCGKTTLGRCIVRAYDASEGQVFYRTKDGEELDFLKVDKKKMKEIRKEIQMIFQDPYSSLDPRMTVLDIIKEPLKANFPKMPKAEMDQRAKTIAEKVGLNPMYLMRYPHAFSGGQRQRIGIARALVIEPQIIVCDEAVSALDVSIQAQVINLLRDLQKELNLTYLFISHDLSMVEFGPAEEMFEKPMHPYTEALLSAVPVADPGIQIERIPLKGEIPNPANPPSGCYFHERCHYCIDKCKTDSPALAEMPDGRLCACHRAKELNLRGFTYDEGARTQQSAE